MEILIGTLIAFVLVGLSRLPFMKKPLFKAEANEPGWHSCPPSSFLPTLKSKGLPPRKVGEIVLGVPARDGLRPEKVDLEVIEQEVFLGMTCPACGAHLACVNCGGTPREPVVLSGYEDRMRIQACCDRPRWGIVSSEPYRSAFLARRASA